jgi:endonuclease/exonuclease/phosphatase (EEP) superfamily protein YafD
VDGLLWVYVGGLLVWVVVRPITGDRSIFVLSLNCLGIWLFFPLLLFGPWVFLKQRKYGAALLVVPTALFLWFYGPLLLPPVAQTADLAESITVLTFNLRHTNTDTEALLATLAASQADVLALQEVSNLHEEHLGKVLLSGRYPYHLYYAPAGLAIYSLYPIVAHKILPMQPWSAQSAVIQVKETSFHLINAHLAKAGVLLCLETLDASLVRNLVDDREAQIARIQGAMRETGLPAIVACDCNMTDLTSAYAQITATLRDAHREWGWGLGHTLLVPRGFEIPSAVNLPAQRIDYLFYSPEISATKVEIIAGESGSDHFPLLAQFQVAVEAAPASGQAPSAGSGQAYVALGDWRRSQAD